MLTIDTNILIYYTSGDRAISDFLIRILEEKRTLFLPTIVIVEFLSFPKLLESERRTFSILFPQLSVVPLTYDIALLAAEIRKVHGLKLGDGVIAATAIINKAPLLTRNVRDFKRIPNLEVVRI